MNMTAIARDLGEWAMDANNPEEDEDVARENLIGALAEIIGELGGNLLGDEDAGWTLANQIVDLMRENLDD